VRDPDSTPVKRSRTSAKRAGSTQDGIALSFHSRDLRPFLDEMSRRALFDKASQTLGSSGPYTNWEAVPLVSEADGIGLYRINQLR
jgi:hypothetical protein